MSPAATAARRCGGGSMAEGGFVLARGLVPARMLRSIDALMRSRAAAVMTALGDRPIGLGSVNGYDELVQRSHNRWDVPMTERDLTEVFGPRGSLAPEVPWLGLVREALGPDATPSFCGVVFSDPGSPPQQWHIDSPHEAPEHRPAHAVNVLLALSDIPLSMGPTEVAPGTHVLTNHLRPERRWLSRDDVLYQTELEYTPETLAVAEPAAPPPSQQQRSGVRSESAGVKSDDEAGEDEEEGEEREGWRALSAGA